MKVYLLYKQTYINYEYGYVIDLISIYKNLEDAEKMRNMYNNNTNTDDYYIEEEYVIGGDGSGKN